MVGRRGARCFLLLCRVQRLRKPEVQNLGVPALGDEDVRGLDVTMDDAFGVRSVERIGDLDSDGEQRLQIQRTVCRSVLQGAAVEVLHDDERLAVFFANVVDRADIGMVEGGRGLGLTPETLQSLAVLGHVFG